MNAPAREAFGIQTYAVAPIVLEDGEVFGTLCVLDSEEVEISEEQRAVLVALSRLIARVHDDQRRKRALRAAADHRDQLADAVLQRADALLGRGDLADDLAAELRQLRDQAARSADADAD